MGCGAPVAQSAAAVECLTAAEQLSTLVQPATAPAAELADGDVSAAIEEALRLLAELSRPVFADQAVVDAVDALHRAHSLATRR